MNISWYDDISSLNSPTESILTPSDHCAGLANDPGATGSSRKPHSRKIANSDAYVRNAYEGRVGTT